MPDFKFKCPHCEQSLEAPEDMLGETIECPACRGSIQLPTPEPATSPLPARSKSPLPRRQSMISREPTVTENRSTTYLKMTGAALLTILKAVFFPLVFFGAGSAVAPLIFIGMILGMFPNIVVAAVSWFITIPLTCVFPLHATYALVVVLLGKEPDYSKGIYGALQWVESKQLYNPFGKKKDEDTKNVT